MLGEQDNCQVGVSISLASDQGSVPAVDSDIVCARVLFVPRHSLTSVWQTVKSLSSLWRREMGCSRQFETLNPENTRVGAQTFTLIPRISPSQVCFRFFRIITGSRKSKSSDSKRHHICRRNKLRPYWTCRHKLTQTTPLLQEQIVKLLHENENYQKLRSSRLAAPLRAVYSLFSEHS